MATRTLRAELAGTIVQVDLAPGAAVALDDVVLVMESMKMEMPVCAPCAGRVAEILVAEGDTVAEGQALAVIEN